MRDTTDAAHTEADSYANEETAYADFVKTYPDYHSTHMLDEWRSTEYRRLDAQRQVYLDYTGGGLYA